MKTPMTVDQGRIRVFQVATGNVGTEMIKRVRNHPDLDSSGSIAIPPRRWAAMQGKSSASSRSGSEPREPSKRSSRRP